MEKEGDKCHSLRLRSARKKVVTDVVTEKKECSKSNNSRHRAAPLSKYRRKTANARERQRMQEVNTAFDKLKTSIPHYKLHQIDEKKDTKITTLRCAITYINSLSQLLNDLSQGKEVSPEYYCTDAQLGIKEQEDKSTSAAASKKKRKKRKGGKAKANSRGAKKKQQRKTTSFKSSKCLTNIFPASIRQVMSQQQQQPLFISKHIVSSLSVIPPPPRIQLPQVPLSLLSSCSSSIYSSSPSPPSSSTSSSSTCPMQQRQVWKDPMEDIISDLDYSSSSHFDYSGVNLQDFFGSIEIEPAATIVLQQQQQQQHSGVTLT